MPKVSRPILPTIRIGSRSLQGNDPTNGSPYLFEATIEHSIKALFPEYTIQIISCRTVLEIIIL